MTEVSVSVNVHISGGVSAQEFHALQEDVVGVKEQIDALTATVTEYNQDVQAKIATLQAAVDAFGNPAEIQNALDALTATVNAGVTAVGDADGDGNPA